MGKVKNNVCYFNDQAIEWSSAFVGTDFEYQYWKWRKFRSSQVNDNEFSETFSLDQLISCKDLNAGINLICSSQLERLKLKEILFKVFDHNLISKMIPLVYYLACGIGTPLYRAANWFRDQYLPTIESPLSENDIAEVLEKITSSDILKFQSLWIKQFPKEIKFSLDITSVSTYSESILDALWGYNRDKETLKQINILLIVAQSSRMPVWFEVLPGAISDVTTLEDTLKTLDQLDSPIRNIVFDRGFASDFNFSIAAKRNFKFTGGIPLNKFINLLEEAKELHKSGAFNNLENLLEEETFNNYPVSAVTKSYYKEGRKIYDHFYYTDYFLSKNSSEIIKKLKIIRDKLKTGKDLIDPLEKFIADSCFKVTKTSSKGITVESLTDKIEELKDVAAGFFVIRSSQFSSAVDALKAYCLRDGVEKRFDDIKNEEDMKRLRMHSDHNMRSRIFLQYLSQIVRCDAINQLQGYKGNRGHIKTVNDIYSLVGSLRIIQIDNHRLFYKYPTKDQKIICNIFGVKMTGSKWSKNIKNLT